MGFRALQIKYIFYIFIIVGLVILWSNPFLRYPYDMIHHLIVIDDLCVQIMHPTQKLVGVWANDVYIMVPSGGTEEVHLVRERYLWHYIWAELFCILDIDSTQMFVRAKIIHVVQTFISLWSVYYVSHVVLRNMFKDIEPDKLRWLSLWSVIIWVTIFATASTAYHQVWIMWYSVNYQIALPLFWYMLGLTLVLLLEETSWKVKLLFTFQILLLSRFILQIHSMEFLYYLMYMLVFGVMYIDRVYLFIKKYIYIFVPTVISIGYFMRHYQAEHSQMFNYLSWDKLPILYDEILKEGAWLLSGYNRASASMNELMYFILYMGGFTFFIIVWNKFKNKEININTRMFIFIVLTSLFVLIPLYQFSGGLFGVITRADVVNRLYYSASLFVLLPIFVYVLFAKYRVRYMNLLMLLLLVSVALFSKYSDSVNHNYYKNLVSITNSLDERKVGFNLNQKQIDAIGRIIQKHEEENKMGRNIKFYARTDMAFVIKYIYHKNVYWEGRRANPDYRKKYEESMHNMDNESVLIEVPKDFPRYEPYT